MCQVGLKSVLSALHKHPSDADIQAKALVVLGVLGQVRCYGFCFISPSQLLPRPVCFGMKDMEHIQAQYHVQSVQL